jgi:hypothetical protein
MSPASSSTVKRAPEPLERVKAMVCEPFWTNCFDSEGFEKLGRGEIERFEPEFSVSGS